MELNHTELAWAAGLFDGEGYIGFKRYGKPTTRHPYGHRFLEMTVSQAGDPYVLKRFANAVHQLKVYGSYQRQLSKKVGTQRNWRPVWIWSIKGFPQVQATAGLLWKYLSPVKRQQAKSALTAWLTDTRYHRFGVRTPYRLTLR